MPTDRVHRTTLEYPKEESAAPHTSPVDRNTRSHKNPKHRRCEGRRRDLPRCRWAAAGPSRASRRPTEPPISTPGTTGVEGAGGTCRGAGGRRRGLAGLRDDAPNHQSAHQAPLVWRASEGPAAVPVGGGGAWPGFGTTRRTTNQHTRHHWCGGRRRDLPRCPWATAGPGCGAYGQQRHYRLPNFARNLSWSFFETPQKHCNSNDANSMFEQAAGELRAKLMGGGGA